jgi:hypothetical protein
MNNESGKGTTINKQSSALQCEHCRRWTADQWVDIPKRKPIVANATRSERISGSPDERNAVSQIETAD